MTVSELIEMLGRCPPEMPVLIAYDSMVVRSDVEESESFIIDMLIRLPHTNAEAH